MNFSISYDAGGSLAVIEVDAVMTENHLGSSVISEHNVEKGANVSDHVRPELDRLSLDVFVSNAPVRLPKTNLDGASGGVSGLDLEVPAPIELPIAIPGVGAALKGAGVLDRTIVVKAQTLQFDDFDRIGSVYHELKTLQVAGTLLTVVTSLREYENMIIKNLSAPRAAGQGDSIHFTIDLQEMRFVQSTTVPVPASFQNKPKVNRGPKPATESAPEPKKSLLKKLIG